MKKIIKVTKWHWLARNARFRPEKSTALSGGTGLVFGLGVGLMVGLLGAFGPAGFFCPSADAQQNNGSGPVVVQPGAPGKPSKRLPASTVGKLPSRSQADVEFMQGMIMHHAQAVEMTALMASHTQNEDLRRLGARISSSQTSEINFMKRWLAARGEPTTLPMAAMKGTSMKGMDTKGPAMPEMDMSGHSMPMMMPGMLTSEQMDALRKANNGEFDHLFLTGMIQHHEGALTMVKDLFNTAGAGQDAEIFDFATDADNTQRAEIRIMQTMLETKSPEEKR